MCGSGKQASAGARRRWALWGALSLVLVLGSACEATPAPTAVVAAPTSEAATATAEPVHATATATPSPTVTTTPTPRATSTLRPTATATLTPTPRPRPTTPSPSELATRYPELAPLLNNPEVDAVYKELAAAYQEGGQEQAMALARERGLLTGDGQVRVDLLLDTDDTAGTVAQLQSMGINVLAVEGNRLKLGIPQSFLVASGNDPASSLNALSGMDHVTSVAPPW